MREALTEFRGHIKTRRGLREVDGRHGSPLGPLVLEMVGCEERSLALVENLTAIDGV